LPDLDDSQNVHVRSLPRLRRFSHTGQQILHSAHHVLVVRIHTQASSAVVSTDA
jgi:hypothetical protein